MKNINKVLLIGNLCRDPKTKDLPSGQPVTTFGVATHRYFTTKSGEKKSVTEFHNIVTWGPLAKRCSEDLRIGKLVYIEGYLKTRMFEDEAGKRSFVTEVVAYNMIILSKREDFNSTDELPVHQGEDSFKNVDSSLDHLTDDLSSIEEMLGDDIKVA